MDCVLIVEDKKNNFRIKDIITEDITVILNDTWNEKDELITSLKDRPAFDGLEKWSDLKADHYKIFIMGSFYNFDTDTVDVLESDSYASLLFFAAGFVRYIFETTTQEVDILTLTRYNDTLEIDIVSRIEATVLPSVHKGINKPTKNFKIVVDNSKS